jgi:uncharacterized membrane protein required for colicin V production
VDLACLAVVVLAALAGAFAGVLSQAAQLAAVAAGWLGARHLGPRLAPLLQGRVPAFAAHPLASVAAFLGCTLLAVIAVRLLLFLTPLRRAPGTGLDRALGALLAAAQASLVVWVALSALVVWGKPVHLGGLVLDPSRSELAALARQHSALGSLGDRLGDRLAPLRR